MGFRCVCSTCPHRRRSAGLMRAVPLPAAGAKGHDRACATLAAPFTLRRHAAVCAGHRQQDSGRTSSNKEHTMITELQTRVIVLQLTNEILEQLKPYMEQLE